MNYKIAYIYNNNKLDLLPYFDNNVEIILIFGGEIISSKDLDLISKAHAIIMDNDVYDANILLSVEKLNLHSSIKYFNNKIIVSDLVSIKASNTYFNQSGRVGENAVSIGELDVEKVARVAYEVADSKKLDIINIDMASTLLASKIWRKIVFDINEDYQNISIKPLSNIDYALTLNPSKDEVLLVHSICLNELIEFLTTAGFKNLGTLYVNDTPQTLAILPKNNIETVIENLKENAFLK